MSQQHLDEMQELYAAQFAEEFRVRELMDFLGIPYKNYQVHISELDKIFSDPKKCQELMSKLKMKAFW